MTLAVAHYYNIKSDYRKSLQYSLKILDENPMDAKTLQSVIFSYRGLGEPNQVLAYGIQFETINPDDLQQQYIMAEMYMHQTRLIK